MTMALPRPSTYGTRPAYLDNLFRETSSFASSSSLHSATSSISYGSTASTYDLRTMQTYPRPLSPALEESSADDRHSVRSLKLNLSPRFNVRKVFNRRTHPQAQEPTSEAASQSMPTPSRSATTSILHSSSRRPSLASLPKLQTSFTAPQRKNSNAYKEKPLPAAPIPAAQELSCHRCYYYAARNCKGWVMGGSHGDACEQCLQAGFFGAP
ncbi:hypothetical protein M433DRAFT_142882 [Acidomyces richmondensis BFW]|nr:MAG: hypothetical protein FE78DRAFT_78642 [Acidomyces sp. 'richmondensis']KYG46519.1 hypothetical protein M433DRAFT_142882 [Acidomyces richmondensis BFW]